MNYIILALGLFTLGASIVFFSMAHRNRATLLPSWLTYVTYGTVGIAAALYVAEVLLDRNLSRWIAGTVTVGAISALFEAFLIWSRKRASGGEPRSSS